jgi:hypothetical protein
MQENVQTKTHTTTVTGNPDLSGVQPADYVAVQPEGARPVLLPARQVLTDQNTPMAEAPDGSNPRLDGAHTIKLGGQVIAVAEAPENK